MAKGMARLSGKLKSILFLSLMLIYLHGMEEVLTGFQHNDSIFVQVGDLFLSKIQTAYWTSHVLLWIFLPLALLLLIGGKFGIKSVLSIFGLIYFFELHHIIKAIYAMEYYPGMVTALLFPSLGILFWKELLRKGSIQYEK